MKKIILLIQAFLCLSVSIHVNAQCNAPVINSFSPNTGFIGSTVTITGANFDAIPANNQVFFGATQATVLTASFGVLTVQVPVGATTAPIAVKNGCNLIAYSATSFNGIFCPTPITATTYNNVAFTLPVSVGAYNMLSQDIDLDGKPDIVLEGFGTGVVIAKNNSTPGNLNFTAINFATGNARSVAVADFDGDGKRDVFVTNTILRNTSIPGTVSFAPAITVPTYNYQVSVGDFNNDGKIDLVGEVSAGMYVMRNISSGPGNIAFDPAVLVGSVTYNCTGIQVGDLDGDGKSDIVATQGNGNRAVSIRNTTTPGSASFSFEAPEYWLSNGVYPYRCQLADFDKDGKVDLATVNYNSPSNTVNTAVLRNTSSVGDISFATALTFAGPPSNYRIGVGDVNGDGLPDIVTKSLGVLPFAVYPNTSSGPGTITFAPRFDYPSAAAAEVSGIVIGDLDGDYVPDIATSGINSNTIRFHRNTSVQVDNAAPTALCKNITVALSPTGNATVTGAMIDNGSSDACGVGSLLINGQPSINFSCADIGPNTVTLTVTDLAGNTATCQAVVTVAAAAIIVTGQTTVCEGQTVTMTANQGDSYQWQKDGVDIPGATGQLYVATESGVYRVTVTNSGGCSGISAPTTVTVNDNPTVTTTPSSYAYLCPPNNNAVLSASLSSLYQWQLNGNDIANATQQTYTATTPGSYTVEVVDLFGCSATSDPIIVSADAPEIDVQGNSTSIADGDNSPDLGDHTDFGSTFPSSSVTRTYTISNSGAGALHIANIIMSGPDAANFTVGGISLPVTIVPTGSVTFTVTFNGTLIQAYSAAVNIATYECDESLYDFAVAADINCQPALFVTCPADIPVNTDANSCGAVVNYTTVTAGNPAPSLSYQFSGATTGSGSGDGSGSVFNTGATTVTITAANGCGAPATCTFTVTVTDNQPPSITCPFTSTQSLNPNNANCTYKVTGTSFNANASDNCGYLLGYSLSGATTGTGSSLNNVVFNSGTTTVSWTATDAQGNSSSCSFNVTVASTLAASIPDASAYSTGVEDNTIYYGWGPASSLSYTGSASGGQPPYGYSWSAAPGLSIVGASNAQTVQVTSSVAGTYVLTLTVTDAFGCTATATKTITVVDVRCGPNLDKVIVCQRQPNKLPVTICVSVNAVATHLGNGSTLGPCPILLSRQGLPATDQLQEAVVLTVKTLPNPSHSHFNLLISGNSNKGQATVKVLNMNGQVLEVRNNVGLNQTIKIGGRYRPGTYLVEVIQGDEKKVITLIKQ